MPDQIYIGNFAKGLKTDRLPFNIDNDAFPTMYNMYSWRGRAKRKRGTSLLGQLERQIESVAVPNFGTNPWDFGPLALQAGKYQLITGNWPTNTNATYHLESTSSIVPGSINIVVNGITYTDPTKDGYLTPTGTSGVNTINYATGEINIPAAVGDLTGTFSYYPGLPVMGLEDFDEDDNEILTPENSDIYPVLLAFDTKYSYQINQALQPPTFYNTTFYKITGEPFTWSGADFQLFWTTNYAGALWATNNKPGFNFVNGTYNAQITPTIHQFTFTSGGVPFQNLIVGDVLWFNEWGTNATVNSVTGTVSTVVNAVLGQYQITFTFGITVTSATGIAQLLTNTISGQDGIKWYDGDPTNTTGIPVPSGAPSLVQKGWVNFAPPLTDLVVSIDNRPGRKYYLVGALAILPFKDRLLVFSPWIQSSDMTLPIQLLDTVLWSWNGTPYYTVSDHASPPTASVVPDGQTADPKAWYVDQTGLGGYLPAGISQPIKTISNNEDVLLIGFGGDGRKTRFVYTGNDLQPFLFFNINSDLPSSSTFSAVSLDRGAIDIGQYGLALTDQQSSQRVDLDIPDEIFRIQALNNGANRVNAIRDFFREWIYFSYPVSNSRWKFPTQTLMFNYRDNTWAIFYENFTVHGYFRPQKKKTWQNLPYKSWNAWRSPWNTGSDAPLFTEVIAGNPQGYVLRLDEGTGESVSGTIVSLANSGGVTEVTSVNHCVRKDDYLLFTGALGTTAINGQIGRVVSITSADAFVVDIPFPAGTYVGLGKFTRLSQPLLQTKQFPVYWNEGRQVRLSVQKYLMEKTQNAQVTVNIYLSQDPSDAWNDPTINKTPSSLIYSQVLYTCPESTNLGLTPFNVNLQSPIADNQYEIWHRINTSLTGDTVQIGITLSDAQMRNITYATSEIALHGIQLTVERAGHVS